MKIEEAIFGINLHRKKLGLTPIHMKQRPSHSAPGKITIEILSGSQVMHKSTHWGAVSPFLKGMLAVFNDKPVVIDTPTFGKSKRSIEF